MKQEEFKLFLSDILFKIRDRFDKKSKEYGDIDSVFQNFIQGCYMLKMPIGSYLLTLRSKHEISILDMVRKMENDKNLLYPIELWEEKVIDSISYLILLLGIIAELNKEVMDETSSQNQK